VTFIKTVLCVTHTVSTLWSVLSSFMRKPRLQKNEILLKVINLCQSQDLNTDLSDFSLCT
jgi:hypothetical protein